MLINSDCNFGNGCFFIFCLIILKFGKIDRINERVDREDWLSSEIYSYYWRWFIRVCSSVWIIKNIFELYVGISRKR